MGHDLVHFFPGVRNRFVGVVAVRIFAGLFFLIGEIEPVVEFHRLIPISLRGIPSGGVVASHAAMLPLRLEKPIALGSGHFARRADHIALGVHRGQAQRGAVGGGSKPEKIVLRAEKLAPVVGRAEGQIRAHGGIVAARDMVRHKVDDHLQPRRVDARHGRLEFLHALRGIHRVVGRDIEVVADRIRAACEPLQ